VRSDYFCTMRSKTAKVPFTAYQTTVILILALTQFSVVLDFMVMSPLGDLLIKDLKINPSEFGIVVSSYALSAGFSGFLTASFADKFDRKKLLLFFYGGFIIGTLLCGISGSYGFLVFARIVTGIFGGVISSISLAIVADLFDMDHRGRVMGFLQMGFGMSQILGIPISLYLANVWNWQAPFFLIVILASCIFLLTFFVLKPVDAHLKVQRDNPLMHMWKTIANRDYRIGFLATAFMSLGGYLMMPWGSAYSVNNIGLAQDDLPFLFMIVGLATFAIMPLVGMISDRFDKFRIFMGASFVMVIAVLIYTNLPVVPMYILIAVNVFMMMGIMARMVPSQALTASVPAMKDRGAFMSINSSLQQMAGGIAALVGGMIVQQKSETSPLERFDTLGYVVIAVILINILLTFRVYKFVMKRNK
jgi:predicted MFS family arabinose efflux permease